MIDESDYRRLARFFAGECSEDERHATELWLGEAPGRRAEAEQLKAMWDASGHPSWTPNTDSAWMRLAARVHAGDAPAPLALLPTPNPQPHHKFRWQRSSKRATVPIVIAASLIATATLAFVAESERFSLIDRAQQSRRSEPTAREFRTARGQRAVVILGDGSRVELGAESILRVSEATAGGGHRAVFLEGQAVFDVVHDAARTFEVRSANAITEDLGTRFTVRAYRGDSSVQVFVVTGKVALRAVGSPATSGTVLNPTDLGVLDSAGRTTVRNGVDSTNYLAWTRDRFVFENAPLGEVLLEVSRRFDVAIDVADPDLLTHRITLNVPARSLSEVLGAVTVPLRLRSAKRGSGIVIQR
jgi:ferric-dicitrate binding protein FerR (iron transport regulator)